MKAIKETQPVGWFRAIRIAQVVYGDSLNRHLTRVGKLRTTEKLLEYERVVKALEGLARRDLIAKRQMGQTLYALGIPGD